MNLFSVVLRIYKTTEKQKRIFEYMDRCIQYFLMRSLIFWTYNFYPINLKYHRNMSKLTWRWVWESFGFDKNQSKVHLAEIQMSLNQKMLKKSFERSLAYLHTKMYNKTPTKRMYKQMSERKEKVSKYTQVYVIKMTFQISGQRWIMQEVVLVII